MCATCSSAPIPPRSCWTGQLKAKVPTARMYALEARQAISCDAARTGSGDTLSTRLLLGSGVVTGASRHQGGDKGSEQGFAAAAGVVHELEEAEVERQLVLRDA